MVMMMSEAPTLKDGGDELSSDSEEWLEVMIEAPTLKNGDDE